ncbi:hypothetical protein F4779DRAFT_588076 [Xylariaceae sp. FL0662B]|nr:hypothetical protein F4779DRAFT_588076 [Xylariaceae sp. FL0662B]
MVCLDRCISLQQTEEHAISLLEADASIQTDHVPVSRACHPRRYGSPPSPKLDLSRLGRVGIAGDFSGISYHQYEGLGNTPLGRQTRQ